MIATGVTAALRSRGVPIQCFKKGPDYIDPMWLGAASGKPCYNLDFNTMEDGELLDLFGSRSVDDGINLIEANKGLYDGVDTAGSDSNAQLAKLLKTPVILVIDTTGMTRGIAPLLCGYQTFDGNVELAGVILNKVGGARHEGKLQAAVETYSDIPVIGSVWRNGSLNIPERHLGLTTPGETSQLDAMIDNLEQVARDSINLHHLTGIAKSVTPLRRTVTPAPKSHARRVRIGIARDPAFGFYYADDLEQFVVEGAELVSFNTLTDKSLPDVDGLFLGGGFPETHLDNLSANTDLLVDIKARIEAGMPCYAECGGLMYLCRSIEWHGQHKNLVGVIPADAVMYPRPQGRGYVQYSTTKAHPWGKQDLIFPAHEFHYARLENLQEGPAFARNIVRGQGIDGKHDGICLHNLVAGFCHIRSTRQNPWVRNFVEFVKKSGRASVG